MIIEICQANFKNVQTIITLNKKPAGSDDGIFVKTLDDDGKALSQQLFDSMFADMDLSLREMGAGDIGVSKRVRAMAEAFMGRLESYVYVIDNDDKKSFSAALKRNLFRGNETIDPLASGLVDYLFALVKEIDKNSGFINGGVNLVCTANQFKQI